MASPPHIPWTREERALLDSLRMPEDIQGWLDDIPYFPGVTFHSPRQVMRDRVANCMEGAVVAAAALEHIGRPPLLMNLKAVRDDDHVLALFRRGDCYGAIAKSNFSGLRWRSPVYRSPREVALSYFDHFYNVERELTLRGYTTVLDLSIRRYEGWQTRESNLDDMSDHLDAIPSWEIVSPEDDGFLRRVDDRLYESGLMGSDESGLWRPDG
jgi:hypothetical protein